MKYPQIQGLEEDKFRRLTKESGVHIHPNIRSLTDTGYQGIHKLHQNSELPKKKTKKIHSARKIKREIVPYLANGLLMRMSLACSRDSK